jgi:hypothetical protein
VPPNEFNPLIGAQDGTATARVKVLAPLTSVGPAMRAELVGASDSGLHLRVPRFILVGSAVQIRIRDEVAFGEVRESGAVGGAYEIQVAVKRS